MSYSLKQKLFSEFMGTALLLAVGLSVVILFWGDGSAIKEWIPNIVVRRFVNGFLFGTTGCIIGLSAVGKISGAHINPSVTFYFWLRKKLPTKIMLSYIAAQISGALIGCLPLLLFGTMGKSINFANTQPFHYKIGQAFVGEMICTAALIILLYFFVGDKKLRNYTPFTMPFLYGIMVCAEAKFSGCSTNLARSFGPAIISHVFTGFWVYLTAPFCGVLLVFGIGQIFRLHQYKKIEHARIAQFKN